MSRVFVITGTRKGIGKALSEHYLSRGNVVCGCSRGEGSINHANYRHFELDVADEKAVVAMIRVIKAEFSRVDVLLNNAGIASMNHLLTTPFRSVESIFGTNFFGSFLFMREVAKLMANSRKSAENSRFKNTQNAENSHSQNAENFVNLHTKNTQSAVNLNTKNAVNLNAESAENSHSQNTKNTENSVNSHSQNAQNTLNAQNKMPFRIVNFATVATPLRLEGEAIYAASKAAIVSLTQIAAKELAAFGISVNALGPTPVPTDLIKNVPAHKMQALLNQQAIKRYGEFADVLNVIDFFIDEKSDFITGQVLYLGGVNG